MPERPQGGPGGLLLSATFMGLGMHLSAWRARSGPVEDYVDPDFYRELARTAERGKLHAVFLADTLTNAEEGTDSRHRGVVPAGEVIAVPLARLWPRPRLLLRAARPPV